MDTINDRIYSLRIQAGISQQRLADDLNLSRRAISLWETGRRTPDIQSVLLLASYFQVSLDYLVKGSRA
jgi:transcriptional regulator with XRE-family HTH domain|uniref:helix-turn-helix domain-containing protein n=1 Tax=Faecalibacterium prausnitzii TaxID=853 RepID=UPI003FF14F8A